MGCGNWRRRGPGCPLGQRYLEILQVAAEEGEARVDEALGSLLGCPLGQGEIGEGKLTAEAVRAVLSQEAGVPPANPIEVAEVALASFDELLGASGETGVVQ